MFDWSYDVDLMFVCGLTGLLNLMSTFICCMQVWSRVRGRCCSPVWRGMIKGKSRWPSWPGLWLRCLHTITAKFVANYSLTCFFYLFLALTVVVIYSGFLDASINKTSRNHMQQSWNKTVNWFIFNFFCKSSIYYNVKNCVCWKSYEIE